MAGCHHCAAAIPGESRLAAARPAGMHIRPWHCLEAPIGHDNVVLTASFSYPRSSRYGVGKVAARISATYCLIRKPSHSLKIRTVQVAQTCGSSLGSTARSASFLLQKMLTVPSREVKPVRSHVLHTSLRGRWK